MQYVLQAFGEVSRSPFNWDRMNMISLGMSSIRPTGPLRRQTMSPTLAYISSVPCVLGVNIMRMAVGTATVLIGLMVRIEGPVQYPFLQDSNGDGLHMQIRLNFSETNVPQAETIRAHQSSKWYRSWTLYGRKGLFERPVCHLQ